MKDIEGLIMTIIAIIVISLVAIKYGLKSNAQAEQIKILEQSLQEQIQEKEVYMKMLESEGKEWNYLKEKKHLKKHQIE